MMDSKQMQEDDVCVDENNNFLTKDISLLTTARLTS